MLLDFTLKSVSIYSHNIYEICFFFSIEVGFITNANKKNISISKCDLELWKHGDIGNPPGDYGFSFWAGKKL